MGSWYSSPIDRSEFACYIPAMSDLSELSYLRATFSVLLYLAALWVLFKIYGGH